MPPSFLHIAFIHPDLGIGELEDIQLFIFASDSHQAALSDWSSTRHWVFSLSVTLWTFILPITIRATALTKRKTVGMFHDWPRVGVAIR